MAGDAYIVRFKHQLETFGDAGEARDIKHRPGNRHVDDDATDSAVIELNRRRHRHISAGRTLIHGECFVAIVPFESWRFSLHNQPMMAIPETPVSRLKIKSREVQASLSIADLLAV